MGWERRGTYLYYYKKIRKGQRVVSEYVGASETAELIYTMNALDRQQLKNERQEWKEKKAEIRAVDLEIDHLNNLLKDLVSATILLSGFHPHKGQWRMNREVK